MVEPRRPRACRRCSTSAILSPRRSQRQRARCARRAAGAACARHRRDPPHPRQPQRRFRSRAVARRRPWPRGVRPRGRRARPRRCAGSALQALPNLQRYRPARFLGLGETDDEMAPDPHRRRACGGRTRHACWSPRRRRQRGPRRVGIGAQRHDYGQRLFVARLRGERAPTAPPTNAWRPWPDRAAAARRPPLTAGARGRGTPGRCGRRARRPRPSPARSARSAGARDASSRSARAAFIRRSASSPMAACARVRCWSATRRKMHPVVRGASTGPARDALTLAEMLKPKAPTRSSRPDRLRGKACSNATRGADARTASAHRVLR